MTRKILHHSHLLKSIIEWKKTEQSPEVKKLVDDAFRRGFHAGLNAQEDGKKRLPLAPSRSYKRNGFLYHADDSGNLTVRRMVRRPPIQDFSDPEYFGLMKDTPD